MGLEMGFCCEMTFFGMGETEKRSSGFLAFGLSRNDNTGKVKLDSGKVKLVSLH